jgi:hypothetical protein
MIKNIHLVTYAEGINKHSKLDYTVTQKLLINSIQSKTKYNVIFHTYNLKKIMEKDWFHYIKDLPLVKYDWNRDGYYNAWKIFLVKEVYDSIGKDDILYYVDSSGYFQYEFEHNIDNLLEYAFLNKNVCGSFGYDLKNKDHGCCNDTRILKIVYSNNESHVDELLNKPHILNSWFLFSKDEENDKFLNEWCYWAKEKLNDIPLIVYHHTVDQSLFNMLVYKYGFKSFYHNTIHGVDKNHNLVHKELQGKSKDEIKKYFINPIEFKHE